MSNNLETLIPELILAEMPEKQSLLEKSSASLVSDAAVTLLEALADARLYVVGKDEFWQELNFHVELLKLCQMFGVAAGFQHIAQKNSDA